MSRNRSFIVLLSALIFLGVGVAQAKSSAKATKVSASQKSSTSNEIYFKKQKIKVGRKIVTVEIADDDRKRERGLMFRDHLPEDTGMLFVFDELRVLSFWMMNTLIPLNIGYFDADKLLIETHEMVPAVMGEARPRVYPSSRPAMYALEMPKGWFKRNGIRPGDSLSFVEQH